MQIDVYAGENSGRAEDNTQVTQITLLLPVWGYRFVGRFLEFCLPTLLAPNNIPALAAELPCRFILLSSEYDVPLITAHPGWRKLAQICTAEIEFIDDFITEGNHSATITLAFERALRVTGAAMRSTCFVFLMSDYLVADGSLSTVLKTIRNGARTVLAGNFQVIAEDAVPLLRRIVDPESPAIVLPPRELVGWSLAHLHPATVANIVNFGLTHNAHTNRLFWQVDETALIGRFYLMHPIAICPEVTDFVVGSSWDYSFVPELCPSGNIATLTDSDEYLVVELQPRDYEGGNLRAGPNTAEDLAAGLSLWATAGHRANVEKTLLFHAGDPPANLSEVAAQADAFVQSVRDGLSTPPVPHQGHPYWHGSIASNRWRSNRPMNAADWNFILNDVPPLGHIRKILHNLWNRLFGFPPAVTRLHPWWPEYQLILPSLEQILASNRRLLLVAQGVSAFAQWVTQAPGDVLTIGSNELLVLPRVSYAPWVGTFDACFLLLDENTLIFCDTLIAHITPLLKHGGTIEILIWNFSRPSAAKRFVAEFAKNAARLSAPAIRVETVQYLESSRFRLFARAAAMRLISRVARRSKFAAAFAAMAAGPILLATYFAAGATRSSRNPPQRGICSGIFVTLQITDRVSEPTRQFEREKTTEQTLVLRAGIEARAPIPEESFGLDGLNWMTDSCARNAPRRLASMLAAYQFAGSLLTDRQQIVAETGVANALGSRLILQKAGTLIIYDPRQRVIAELQRQFAGDRAFDARWHDMVGGPAPQKVDSIVSIDFIQYLAQDEGDAFVGNLRDSLKHEFGFALVGCPSFGDPDTLTERADYCAPDTQTSFSLAGIDEAPSGSLPQPSRALPPNFAANPAKTRIYRRSGEELVTLMRRYFQNVFAFSLNEQTIQPGIHPNAQHVFVLGCGKKTVSGALGGKGAARQPTDHFPLSDAAKIPSKSLL